ncbi:hypothetical protein [Fictibacillus macauensis]|uniref:hypothetical protein n=1 Tax=Fictibacillus macauensis TaxID=245160 RepID=UPI00030AD639|nr:hypothetical protein [Fictibacillus macauensis]
MSTTMPSKDVKQGDSQSDSKHGKRPPRNPNKRPTTINMDRSIGRMKANDRDAIRQAL